MQEAPHHGDTQPAEQTGAFFCSKSHIPVVVSHQHPRQLDVVAGAWATLANGRHSLFYHVEQPLRQLRVFTEIHKMWQVVVRLKCDACFLVEVRKRWTITTSMELLNSFKMNGLH